MLPGNLLSEEETTTFISKTSIYIYDREKEEREEEPMRILRHNAVRRRKYRKRETDSPATSHCNTSINDLLVITTLLHSFHYKDVVIFY